MSETDGYPVIYWTIKRIFENIPDAEVIIAAPAFDRGGELEFLVNDSPFAVSIFYGHDASPLSRILEVCRDLGDQDYIIRIDGQHFFVDVAASLNMLDIAINGRLDCVKFPDDFPVQFASDIYRIGALRHLHNLLEGDALSIFKVHPKFYMFMRKDIFQCAYLEELPRYADDYLRHCRRISEPLFSVPRLEVGERRIWAGDQLSFHYEWAMGHLQPEMSVLDVACGDGYGARMMAQKGFSKVHGADLDPEVIAIARQLTDGLYVSYHVEDVTKMTFDNNYFDAITSMETLEHVDAQPCLQEFHRVLKPGGRLILSTPQNRLGRIPVTPIHLREYSLDELVSLCNQYFAIQTAVGIKAGRIVIPGDPYGANTMLVCRKEQ